MTAISRREWFRAAAAAGSVVAATDWGSTAEAGQLKPGARCLVIDVGGGTSDFSLIQAVEQQGELTFVRQAVGDHLLLGGSIGRIFWASIVFLPLIVIASGVAVWWKRR